MVARSSTRPSVGRCQTRFERRSRSSFASPRPCSYLPDQTAALEYRLYQMLTATQYSQLLGRGWSAWERTSSAPAAPPARNASACASTFRPSDHRRASRRCRQKNREIETVVSRPEVSGEQIALYNAYHADMQARRGWPNRETSPAEYFEGFLAGPWDFPFEVRYLAEGRLVGLGLIDIVPDAISSVYFYHAPEWRSRGLGTFSILHEIELARELGKRWLYLGYWVGGCQSMAYKNQFEPHELLSAYVADKEIPVWKRPDPPENQDG